MRCSTLLGILTGVLLYLVLGAVVFRSLEAPREEGKHMRLQDARRDFLLNFTCMGPDDLQTFIEEVVEAVGAGVDPGSNLTFVSQWDLASAFFFSGTIITTIGFGNISPKTEGGQLFCIFYALVGIPMFGFLLAGVGDHLGTGLRKAVAKIETLFRKWRVSPTIVRVISAVLSILLGCLLFVAVPILIFQEVEDWTYLESAYFVVITLTTVGFGDYVAGSDHWYKPLVWFWILLGLAYFASVLTMIGNWLRVLSKKTRAEVLLLLWRLFLSLPLPLPHLCVHPLLLDGGAASTLPEEKPAESPPDPLLSQPLDHFGENLAFIDESSDAQSGKLHLDPLRRQRRPVPQRSPKLRSSSRDKKEPNGNPQPISGLPVEP
uniref:Potassium two pore domain channel subfamily K member 4 n=1 Tax=Gasterosteus aculeatus aculeatus TaxID=481459 RepID=A0AAQ4QJ14_GASAC